ncbi:NfeD family protein [Haliangium sp.]|uniref:NfeD family protein n=1 Tax=Haliangium sp. TaxID=2663208 RepID=UPI003D115615
MTAIVIVIGLMVVGLSLIALEVLVIPGFGVLGVLGIAAGIAAGYLAVTRLEPTHAGLAITAGVVAAAALFWYLPRTRTVRSMVLQTQTLGTAGDPALKALMGREGVTTTPLRPAGAVEIDGEAVDVVSDGQYVEPGTRVRVIEVSGSRVLVEPMRVAAEDSINPPSGAPPAGTT